MGVVIFSLLGLGAGALFAASWWALHMLTGLYMPPDAFSPCLVLGIAAGCVLGFIGEFLFG